MLLKEAGTGWISTPGHYRADPNSIGSLLKSFDIERNLSVLSLDIDGNDYWVLKAILSEFRPALIVTEINEKIPRHRCDS